jgi:hypothetical protein
MASTDGFNNESVRSGGDRHKPITLRNRGQCTANSGQSVMLLLLQQQLLVVLGGRWLGYTIAIRAARLILTSKNKAAHVAHKTKHISTNQTSQCSLNTSMWHMRLDPADATQHAIVAVAALFEATCHKVELVMLPLLVVVSCRIQHKTTSQRRPRKYFKVHSQTRRHTANEPRVVVLPQLL